MNSENRQHDMATIHSETDSRLEDAKLLKLNEDNQVKGGNDINTKITALDSDLARLRVELGVINNSVEEGLDRLGDKDTDLTAKVSETYKRLGEIDRAYKSLLDISTRIDHDIQKLNGDVSHVAEQSASDIKSLEKSTISQSKELAQKNQQVATKVNHLVETSRLTSEMMNQSIHSVTEKMLLMEKSVVAQIESLAESSRDKAQAIEKSVDQNKAKILKLQSVDEAIIKRATLLEITAAELTAKGQYLDSSVEQLQISSDNLTSSINRLKTRTGELETLTAGHGLLISSLQKAGADLSDKLVNLSSRENTHFRFSVVTSVILILLALAVYISQQHRFGINEARFAENNQQIVNQITATRQAQSSAAVKTENHLAELENRMEKTNSQMQSVQDQVQSVAGRLNQAAPFGQIGNDNVIHGPHWITDLPKENYAVQIAYVDNKDALYKIAQRYNYLLKDSLSYFAVSKNGEERYVLLSGNYSSLHNAENALDSLPGYIDQQQPVVRKIEAAQQYITGK